MNVEIKTSVEMNTCFFLLCIYHCQAGCSVLQKHSEADFQDWIVLIHEVSIVDRNITTKYSKIPTCTYL